MCERRGTIGLVPRGPGTSGKMSHVFSRNLDKSVNQDSAICRKKDVSESLPESCH